MPRADVWFDGALAPWDRVLASPLCHGMQRGALVFDVGRMRPGPAGERLLFRPREHIDRFLRSAAFVGITVPWDAPALLSATLEVARAAPPNSPNVLVRWTAFVPTLEADVVPRPSARASVVIAVIAPEDSLPEDAPATAKTAKPATVRVWVPRDLRKAGPEVFPPHAKVSASYLGPMLAKRRALAAGFDEVLLLDREGRVAEAPTANVFVARQGTLVTPPAELVLPGITRDTVLAIARAEGIPVSESHLSPEQLEQADEAFLTATSLPVQAVAAFGASTLGATPGPLTARIRDLLLACEHGRDPRFASWTVVA